jgi:hypothetical protein
MMLPRQLRPCFQTIRKPGKTGPAVFAFSDPRPLLRNFTKNIDSEQNPLPRSTLTGSGDRGFGENRCLRSQHRRIGLDQRTGRDPSMPSLPYHAQLQSYTRPTGFFCKWTVLSCRMRSSAVKHWNTGMDTKGANRGDAVGRPSS